MSNDEHSAEEPSSLSVRLADLWAVAQMQWHVIVVSAAVCVGIALVYSMFATRLYRSTVVLHLATVAGHEVDAEGVLDYDQLNRSNRQLFVMTQLEILKSRPLREEVIRRYNAQGYTDLTPDNGGPEQLLGLFTATPRAATELVDLSVTCTDPEKAAVLANIIANTYIEQNLDARVGTDKSAVLWLVEQIKDSDGKIKKAAADLASYKEEHHLADIDEETSTIESRLAALNTAHGEVAEQAVELDSTVSAQESAVKAGKWEDLVLDLNSPVIAALAEQLSEQQVDFLKVSTRYGKNFPVYQQAEDALATTRDKLEAEVRHGIAAERTQLGVLRSRQANLEKEIEVVNEQLLDRQALRTDYDMLVAAVDLNKQNYEALNKKLQETTLASETQRNNIRIVDDARVKKAPVSPQPVLNAGAGLVIGLLLGVALAFLREQIDDTVGSPLDVSTYLRVPYLGMIPKISDTLDESELALYTFQHPTSSAAEAIRAIRTVIELNPTEDGLKRLLVTSAVSSEGKTSTVVRLGVAFANLGKRVVMIDGDLRRPRLHKIFQVERDLGLTDLLAGAELERVVHGTGVPNLFFIPAGPAGDLAAEPLASAALERLLDRIDEAYDLAIIDSPPSGLLSDAAILSKRADGVVMVVRESMASRMLIRDAIRSLDKVGANVLGVVVNAVDPARRRGKYYYYYNYYGYNYRYNRYYSDSAPESAAK